MSKRANHKHRKEQRRVEAEQRQTAAAARTYAEHARILSDRGHAHCREMQAIDVAIAREDINPNEVRG